MMEFNYVSMALGAVVGLVMTLTGAGGGVLGVPLLVFGLQLTVQVAAPISLLAVGSSALVSSVWGLRDGIGFTGMAFTPLGVWLAGIIPNMLLTLVFSVLLLTVAWRMLKRSQLPSTEIESQTSIRVPCIVNPQIGRLIWTPSCARALMGTGVMSGVLSGMLGVGGGFVIIPALTRYTDLNPRSIVATSLTVIALVSMGSLISVVLMQKIAWSLAIPFALGSIAIVPLGRRIAVLIQGRRLQQIFAWICILVSLLLLIRSFIKTT
jgi:uncharacterized protein